MLTEFSCSNCNATLKAPSSYAGKKAKCKGCGSAVVIPPHPDDEGYAVDGLDSPSKWDDVTAPASEDVSPPPLPAITLPVPPLVPTATKAADQTAAPRSRGVMADQSVTRMQGYVVIVLLLVGLGTPLFGILRPMPRWEYKIVSPSDTMLEDEIGRMGNQGWELITARRASSKYGDPSYEMIFKRPQ